MTMLRRVIDAASISIGCVGLACAGLAAGCEADAPTASTEGLEEIAPGGGGSTSAGLAPGEPGPDEIGPPAHAALPSWVPATLGPAIEASRLPVMLPREPAIDARTLATATVLTEDRWVSAHLETATYIATIFGTDAHHEPPRGAQFALPEPDRTIRGQRGYAYENEGLHYAQWQEDGIAWDVEVDCLSSCDGVGLAVSIAESLEPVGGVR